MKKFISILIIFLQIVIISASSFAVGIGDTVALYSKEKLDNIKMNYYGQDIVAYYTVYKDNDIEYPAYCVNYEFGGITDVRSYNAEVTSEYENLGVWRAIVNGYPFKTPEELNCNNIEEAYAATKQAVFCMLYDRDFVYYTYTGDVGKRVYDAMINIVETARASTQTHLNTEITLSETEWELDDVYLSKKISLSCETKISEFIVELEGNIPENVKIVNSDNIEMSNFENLDEFKILIPLESLKLEDEMKVIVKAKVMDYPMFYAKAPEENLQNYVITAGKTVDQLQNVLIKYPENKTKLKFNKKDLDGNFLEGVVFNLLDSNKEIYIENLKTDEFGNIELKNVVPGTYYLEEIKTLDGYEKLDELIEIQVEYNEEKELEIINEKIPEPEIPEVPEEPEIPEKPETQETPEVPEQPKLPRTGF